MTYSGILYFPVGVLYTGQFTLRSELIIIRTSAVICRRKRNTAITFLSRCGDNFVTEDDDIGFPSLGDTGQYNVPCSRMMQEYDRGVNINLGLCLQVEGYQFQHSL
jgi:hypothetical protein